MQSEQAKTIIWTQKSKRYPGETSAEEPGLSVFTPSCVCVCACMCVCSFHSTYTCLCHRHYTNICLVFKAALPFFLSFWLELKSMVTQLQNVDLSTDFWLLKSVWGALYKYPIRSSIRAAALLIADYGPIKTRRPVPGVLFCQEAILHIGKEHQCSLKRLKAVYWLSTREQSQPFGSYSSFQTVLR